MKKLSQILVLVTIMIAACNHAEMPQYSDDSNIVCVDTDTGRHRADAGLDTETDSDILEITCDEVRESLNEIAAESSYKYCIICGAMSALNCPSYIDVDCAINCDLNL